MELETLRAIRDWLDGTTATAGASVNGMIASTPRDGTDPAPSSIVSFGDASRDAWVALKHWPRDASVPLPALAIYLEPPFTVPGEPETIVLDAHPTISIVQIDERADSEVLRRDALYRRRAILRSLNVFNQNDNAGARRRNDVSLLVCESREVGQLTEPFGDAFALDLVKATYLVRDHAP